MFISKGGSIMIFPANPIAPCTSSENYVHGAIVENKL